MWWQPALGAEESSKLLGLSPYLISILDHLFVTGKSLDNLQMQSLVRLQHKLTSYIEATCIREHAQTLQGRNPVA